MRWKLSLAVGLLAFSLLSSGSFAQVVRQPAGGGGETPPILDTSQYNAVVEIGANNEIKVGKKIVKLDELVNYVPKNGSVLVKAASKLQHSFVTKVIDALADKGLKRVGLTVLDEPENVSQVVVVEVIKGGLIKIGKKIVPPNALEAQVPRNSHVLVVSTTKSASHVRRVRDLLAKLPVKDVRVSVLDESAEGEVAAASDEPRSRSRKDPAVSARRRGPNKDDWQNAIFKLKYLNSMDLMPHFNGPQRFRAEEDWAVTVTRDVLTAQGTKEAIAELTAFLKKLDVPTPEWRARQPVLKIIKLKYSDASELADTVTQLFRAEKVNCKANTAANAIVVQGPAAKIEEITALAQSLDKTASERKPKQGNTQANSRVPNGLGMADIEWSDARKSLTAAEIARIREQYLTAEEKAHNLAMQVRSAKAKGTQQNYSIARLQTAVRSAFELRQKLQRAEVQKLRQEVQQIQRQIERRQALGDKIIERRVDQLLSDDELRWEGPLEVRNNRLHRADAPLQSNSPDEATNSDPTDDPKAASSPSLEKLNETLKLLREAKMEQPDTIQTPLDPWRAELARLRECKGMEELTITQATADASALFAVTSPVQTKEGRHLVVEILLTKNASGHWQRRMIDIEPLDNTQRDLQRFWKDHPQAKRNLFNGWPARLKAASGTGEAPGNDAAADAKQVNETEDTLQLKDFDDDGDLDVLLPQKTSLLFFHADWCLTCQTVKKEMEKRKRQGFPIVLVDATKPQAAKAFSKVLNVKELPAYILSIDGKEAGRATGADFKPILQKLKDRLPSNLGDVPARRKSSKNAGQMRGRIPWNANLVDAQKLAAQQTKPILIYFRANNCRWCTTLENNVLSRADVSATLNRLFVPVQIEAPSTDLARKYGLTAFPSQVIVDSEGQPVDKSFICEQDSAKFTAKLVEQHNRWADTRGRQ